MAREINAELLDTKIEKAQKNLVKAKHRYDSPEKVIGCYSTEWTEL